jgi:hypothetical protein
MRHDHHVVDAEVGESQTLSQRGFRIHPEYINAVVRHMGAFVRTRLMDINAVVHRTGIVGADHQVFQDDMLRVAHLDQSAVLWPFQSSWVASRCPPTKKSFPVTCRVSETT